MHDRRVIRGSTYSLRRSIQNKLSDMDARSSKVSRRRVSKRRVKNRKSDLDQKSIKTPRPVSGRLHAEIQTDPYLEEIFVSKKEQEFGPRSGADIGSAHRQNHRAVADGGAGGRGIEIV